MLLTWGPTMVEVMKIMVTSLKGSHACTATVRAPNPAAGHLCVAHAYIGDSQTPTGKSGTVSRVVTVLFSWVLMHKVLLCPPRVYFPVLCKLWQLCGGANGDLFQEDLCHTHTQSP